MPKLMQVTREQVLEWLENPVTLVFKEFARQELENTITAKGLDAFTPFDAYKTQEILANLNGARDVWEDVTEALNGEGLAFEEDLDE